MTALSTTKDEGMREKDGLCSGVSNVAGGERDIAIAKESGNGKEIGGGEVDVDVEEEGRGDVLVESAGGGGDEEKMVDKPPDGGWGWVMVGCVSVINAHTWGLNSAYGVFLAHYLSNSLFPGATRLDYAFIGGLSISQALFVSPVATLTTRIFGTRTTLLVGVALQTASLIAASFATRIWHLFLSQGVCFGWGMGFLFVGSVVITPQWFERRRSLANGIAAAGSGIGGLIYSLATESMIKSLSLPWAFRILGLISCIVNFTCALILKDRNKQIGSSQLSLDVRLFRKLPFLGLLTFGSLSMLGYIVLLFSLPAYARSIGLSAKQGSIIGAVLNLGQALGRPPVGYWSDAFGRVNMAASMTFLSGLFALVVWMFAKSFGVLVFYAIIGGSVAGTFWAVVGPVYAEVLGLRDLPSCLSLTWVVLVLPTTFSEPIALELVSFNGGSYTGAIAFAGVMYIAAAGFLWLVRTWKIGELEREARARGDGDGEVTPFLRRLVVWRKV